MSERLVIVQNPNSTHASLAEKAIRQQLDTDVMFESFFTKYTSTEDNINSMREVFRNGDRIIAAGGDGTAMQIVNAVLREEHTDTEVAFTGFGNFNDLATAHAGSASLLDLLSDDASTVDLFPLTIEVDDTYWRDAPAYMTMGWTALAAAEFGSSTSRDSLRGKPRASNLAASLHQLLNHYAENRHFKLPAFTTDVPDSPLHGASDVLAVNNPRVGSIVRSRDRYYDGASFGYAEVDVSRIIKNMPFGLKSIAGHAPTAPRQSVTVEFDAPATVPIQSEGEFAQLNGVSTISIYKSASKVRVIHPPTR